MDKKRNIMHLMPGLGIGGAERLVLDLCRYMNGDGFNTYVISLSSRSDMLKEFVSQKVQVEVLGIKRNIFGALSAARRLNGFVRRNKINVLHAHMFHPIVFASILKILNPGLKIVFTPHNVDIGNNWLNTRIRECIVFLLRPFRDVDICFSKNVLRFFYKNKYAIIPNGIETVKYELRTKKYDKFTIISVGRLEPVKNHKFLIEMANLLRRKAYDFQLLIIGEGYLRQDIARLIEDYGLEGHVKLMGLRRDVPALLAASHCFVMPSLWEGMPISILEASALGMPVISTPVGSIPSVLNSENSYIVRLAEFEKTIIHVIENYEEALEKGLRLRAKIREQFDITNIAKRHKRTYKALVQGG